MPGARTPSSLTTRMRYGGGWRNCCAATGASSNAASVSVRKLRNLNIGGQLCLGHFVEHQSAPHLFHRYPLSLVRVGTMDFGRLELFVQPRHCAAAQLFRAHGGDVNEEKTAFRSEEHTSELQSQSK